MLMMSTADFGGGFGCAAQSVGDPKRSPREVSAVDHGAHGGFRGLGDAVSLVNGPDCLDTGEESVSQPRRHSVRLVKLLGLAQSVLSQHEPFRQHGFHNLLSHRHRFARLRHELSAALSPMSL